MLLFAILLLVTNEQPISPQFTNAILHGFDGTILRGSFILTNEPRGGSDTPAFRTYAEIGTNDLDFVILINGTPHASLIFNNGANYGRQGLPTEWVMSAQTLYFAGQRLLIGYPSDTYGGNPKGIVNNVLLRDQGGYSVPLVFGCGNQYTGLFATKDKLVLGDLHYSTQRSPWCIAISNTIPYVTFSTNGVEILKGGLIVNGWRIGVNNTGLIVTERVGNKPVSKLQLTSPKHN